MGIGYSGEKIKVRAYTTGKITSSGNKPHKGQTIAVSRDLIKKYYGKRVIIINAETKEKVGVFKVDDKMKKTHRKAADIYMGKGNKKRAKNFGVMVAYIKEYIDGR